MRKEKMSVLRSLDTLLSFFRFTTRFFASALRFARFPSSFYLFFSSASCTVSNSAAQRKKQTMAYSVAALLVDGQIPWGYSSWFHIVSAPLGCLWASSARECRSVGCITKHPSCFRLYIAWNEMKIRYLIHVRGRIAWRDSQLVISRSSWRTARHDPLLYVPKFEKHTSFWTE